VLPTTWNTFGEKPAVMDWSTTSPAKAIRYVRNVPDQLSLWSAIT
jgi:hypothetical protein